MKIFWLYVRIIVITDKLSKSIYEEESLFFWYLWTRDSCKKIDPNRLIDIRSLLLK